MSNESRIDQLVRQMRKAQQDLEDELDRLLEEKREEFQYTIRRGRVVFEQRVRRLQRSQRIGLLRYVFSAPMAYLLTAPIIYGMAVPLALLDLSITIYQQICFRVYGIPLVRRSDYLVIDRQHLDYLNAVEKFNCVYCGYGNGVIAYAREITARTEQFWCPIKHAQRARGAHHRTDVFFDYGDAEAYRDGLEALRKEWNDASTGSDQIRSSSEE